MRWLSIELMALTTILLSACSGGSQAVSAATAMPVEEPASIVGTGEQSPVEAPPTSRPEPAPAAPAESAALPPELGPSPPLQDVVQQLRAGVEEKTILAYIGHSDEPFHVDSTAIIFLTDLGASGTVIQAMMERDEELRGAESEPDQAPGGREPWPPAGEVAAVPTTSTAAAPPEATEAVPETIRPPDGSVTLDYFYVQLAPYGTWLDVPGYGRCWQPTVAVSCPGWIPYGDRGRWVYTDHGWYWYSDYSWGWAAFHYGRWFHHSRWGWCWVPGTVWGPSWVSWRYADAYCGWAPLPPYRGSGWYFSVGISWGIPSWCYTYVPSYRICTYRPRTCAVPYHEARAIHHRSKPRDHYAVGRNHTIENRGIPPEELSRDPDRDIRRARVEPRREPGATGVRRERLAENGSAIDVFRPRVSRSGSATASPGRLEDQGSSYPRNSLVIRGRSSDESNATRTRSRGQSAPAGLPSVNRTQTRGVTRDTLTTPSRPVLGGQQDPGNTVIRSTRQPATSVNSSRSTVRTIAPPSTRTRDLNSPRSTPDTTRSLSRPATRPSTVRPPTVTPQQPTPPRTVTRPTVRTPSAPRPAPTSPARVRPTPSRPSTIRPALPSRTATPSRAPAVSSPRPPSRTEARPASPARPAGEPSRGRSR